MGENILQILSLLILLRSLKPKCWKVKVLKSAKTALLLTPQYSTEAVCCWVNYSLALFSLALFPFIQSALPWAAEGWGPEETLLKCLLPWPVRPCALPTTGENWLCASSSTASASVPAFTVKIHALLFKSEVEEERVFPKTPGIKRRWVGFSHSFLLAT